MELPGKARNRVFQFLGANDLNQTVSQAINQLPAPTKPAAGSNQTKTTQPPTNKVSRKVVLKPWEVESLPCFTKQEESTRGFVVKDNALDWDDFARLACAVRDWNGELKQAGMGKNETQWQSNNVRGDRMAWVSNIMHGAEGEISSGDIELHRALRPLKLVLDSMEQQLSNYGFRFSGKRTCMLANYAGNGAQYVRHRDVNLDKASGVPQSQDGNCRVMTVILYLNPGWGEGDERGGELLIEPCSDCDPNLSGINQTPVKLAPTGNRLVLFRSTLAHQVNPSYGQRWALTTWLYGKALPLYRQINQRQVAPESMGTICNAPRLPGAIFVAIPCYCDPELPFTIANAFDMAEYPERIFIGVCWQCDLNTESYQAPRYPERVKFQIIPSQLARGPCVARWMAQQLWSGEEYMLQIDSHMRFVKNWDSKLIDMLKQCPSNKAILTTYPADFPNSISSTEASSNIDEMKNTVPVLYPSKFDEDGMLRQAAKLSPAAQVPQPCGLYAAGFNFARADHLTIVPYIPMQDLFFGEEPMMAVRLWTNGWDFFTPTSQVVFHKWSRKGRSTFKPDSNRRGISLELVRRFLSGSDPKEVQDELDLGVDLGLGMDMSWEMDERDVLNAAQLEVGPVRTLDAYEEFVKVSFKDREVKGNTVPSLVESLLSTYQPNNIQ